MGYITEIRGNIFESSCQTIVNNVNCVGIMGKGIALEYKNRFPDMYNEYSRFCKDKLIKPGILHLWKKSTPWILNFPTKNHWKYPSKIDYIKCGLEKFANSYMLRDISSIAFPELGTSAGGLSWSTVRSIMYSILEPLPNLEIEIYHYNPNAHDTLFDKLYQRIHRLNLADYKQYIGIGSKQAKILISAFASNKLHTMDDLQALEGIGEKTIEALYRFASPSNDSNRRIVTNAERQPCFPF
jgi:O-acetyl-ADP-ribose deacetylase (regulator of RNase III)